MTYYNNADYDNVIIEQGSLEIRRLTEREILPALLLATMTYQACLEPTVADPQMNRYFYEYLDREKLNAQIRSGSLYLWGACIREKLLGIASLTNTGQITMFYVHPDYRGQGIGEKLLQALVDFAPQLYLNRLAINASPGWTGSWFGYEGFTAIANSFNRSASFVPMMMKLSGVRNYPRRPLSETKILLTVLGTLALCTLITAGYSIWFIF